VRELIARLDMRGAESVLDVGCGDGKVTAEIARAVPNGHVLGVDNSPEFIAFASTQFPVSEFPHLEFRHMDARCLAADRQFDIVFSNATLHWVHDHRAFLRGVRRLLSPRGRLVTSCGGHGNAAGVVRALELLAAADKWHRYFQGFPFPYFFYSPEDYHRWLPEAGLRAIRCELAYKDMTQDGRVGLAGWIRTTWMPYTNRVPETLQDDFVNELVDAYLDAAPLDAAGRSHVKMVRLQVEAVRDDYPA
jgi:trans-aconitate methyltransferase